MPFKIVQTIEHGKKKLTTVPDQWEINGILYWPKSTKKEKHRKDEDSIADYSKWSQINCIVKRKNIFNFEDAEGEIDIMSNNSETETDNETPIIKKRLPTLTTTTFNDMAEVAASTSSISLPLTETQSNHDQYIAPKKKRPVCPNTQEINKDASSFGTEITNSNNLPIIHINEKDFIFQSVSLQEEMKENENVEKVLKVKEIDAETKSVMKEISIIKNDIRTVTENQSILSSNQNTIIAQNSELSIKFEEFMKLFLSTKTNTNPSESGTPKIYNLETLKEFERQLDQPDSRDELYRQYSVILNKGIGKGTTNAYTLVDAMFDRKFFPQCSWTGVSKGDTEKICFKGFTKTINFFFNIVYESDKTFTKAQLTKFFKIILRNARYRSQNEQARMSAQRQKKKFKLKTKKSLPTSSQDSLENPPSDKNQELRDLEGETNPLSNVPLLQENHQNDSADSDVEDYLC